MTDITNIRQIAEEKIAGSDLFLVDVTVKNGNKIQVLADSHEGIRLEQCAELSKHIESKLDREKQDFELVVSSPGLTKPFMVEQQYVKNIGRQITFINGDGNKHNGLLQKIEDQSIEIKEKKKIKASGGKKKQTITENNKYNINEIRKVKVLISI